LHECGREKSGEGRDGKTGDGRERERGREGKINPEKKSDYGPGL